MLKRIIFSFVILSAACAQAEIFSLDSGNVSFDAPDEFTELTSEDITLKFPSSRAPQFVVGNEERSTTIAYDWKQDRLLLSDLAQFKDAMVQMFNRIVPGIQWKEDEVVEINGREFVHLEFISSAVDTDIYNIMLATSYQDRMLVFNFNSTVSDFETVEDDLRRTVETIFVRD